MARRKYKTRKSIIGDALLKGFLGGWLLDEVKPISPIYYFGNYYREEQQKMTAVCRS